MSDKSSGKDYIPYTNYPLPNP